MKQTATVFILLVALLHVWIMILEMFLWQSPYGLKTFGMTPEVASASATLAANQGLYNGFLAAGLFIGLAVPNPSVKRAFILFFLSCIILAGIYGGITAKPKIILIQSLPALIALIFYLLSKRNRRLSS